MRLPAFSIESPARCTTTRPRCDTVASLIGVYLVALSVISFVAVSVIKDPMGVDLNVREVHDEYLREHPEIAAADLGVAGETAG